MHRNLFPFWGSHNSIVDTNIDHSFRAISKDSEKEKDFIAILIKKVSNLNLSNIQSKDNLENLV